MGNTDLIPALPLPYLIRQRVGGEWKPATLTIVDKNTWKVKYPASEPAPADRHRQERRQQRPRERRLARASSSRRSG